MLLVTLLLKTLLSISQNRREQITLNKQLGYHLNKDILNNPTDELISHILDLPGVACREQTL